MAGVKPPFKVKPLWLAGFALLLTASFYFLDLQARPLPASGELEILRQAELYLNEGRNAVHFARQKIIQDAKVEHDINRTGLIGLPWTPITTSGGNLEAKRTATDPDWVKVLVYWLLQEGVEPGDVILASFSGSFPGLNLAVMAAARALELKLFSIASVGSSSYGANLPDFTWLDMESALRESGWPEEYLSVAASLGGESDNVADLSAEGRALALEALTRSGMPALLGGDFAQQVTGRIDLYDSLRGAQDAALYINVGGASASTGYCADWFEIPNGFVDQVATCPGGAPGVMQHMSTQDVRVLHLLDIRKLAFKAGIPIDRRF